MTKNALVVAVLVLLGTAVAAQSPEARETLQRIGELYDEIDVLLTNLVEQLDEPLPPEPGGGGSLPAEPTEPTDCHLRTAGTPLPYRNSLASLPTSVLSAPAVHLGIFGHSESSGYDAHFRRMAIFNCDTQPPSMPFPGPVLTIDNYYHSGQETYEWITPGSPGDARIEEFLDDVEIFNGPAIALVLTTNNVTYPLEGVVPGTPNFDRFVSDCLTMADRLHAGGLGAGMVYFSAHRYKALPENQTAPAWRDTHAIGEVIRQAEATGRGYVQAGPEQHQLHWCCFPRCYNGDLIHPNVEGQQLMALTWYTFLRAQFSAGEKDVVPPAPPPAATYDLTIQWDAPTVNVDGSALTDLGGFRVSTSGDGNVFTDRCDVGAAVRECAVSLTEGHYWARVVAYDTSGNQSTPAEIEFDVPPGEPPPPPPEDCPPTVARFQRDKVRWDGVAEATAYEVWDATDQAAPVLVRTASASSRNHPGESGHLYYVVVVCGAERSPASTCDEGCQGNLVLVP